MKQSTTFAQVATNLLNVLQGYTKTIRLLLVMFLTLTVSTAWGADVTISVSSDTWTETGTSGSGGATKVSKDGITVSSNKGYKDATTAIREYSGGKITVSSSSNITKIVFTSTANKGSKYGPDCIALNSGSAGTYTTSSNSNLGTWTGTAKSITFTCSAQFRWKQVVVTTESSHTVTWTINPAAGGSLSPTSGTSTTVTPNVAYTYDSPAYTVTPAGKANVSQDGDNFTATPSANCTIQINMVAKPKYTVNWYVNETKEHSQIDIAGTTLTNIPDLKDYECGGKVFVGWTTQPSYEHATDAPNDLITNTTGMTIPENGEDYYAVFAESGGTPTTTWSKTDIANIKSTDEVVITMSNGVTTWALRNEYGTSEAPYAESITITNEQISSKVGDVQIWNISNSSGNLTIYPKGKTTTWLYCTNTNDGVRVGTNANKTFTISGNYLKHTGTSRYVGVYVANPDWRCYTSTTGNSNIAGQTLAFYKKTTSGYKNYTTECAQTDCSLLTFATNIPTNHTATCTQNTSATALTVSAKYDGNSTGVTYQWYSNTTNSNTNGTLITNATSASYKPSTTEVGTTYYYCVATYDECTITSNVATIVVNPAYIVTFDSDGGSAVTEQTIEKGKTATKPENPEKAGHTFVGWYNGDTEFDFDTPITGNITLKAKWTVNQYKVTLNPNYPDGKTGTFKDKSGNPISENLVLTYDYNTASMSLTDLYQSIELEGYQFNGWYSATSGGSHWIETGVIKKNVTVYAQWSKLYTITLSENGTPTEPTTQTSTTYKLPAELTAGSCQDDTKELVGWSTVAIPTPGDMPTSDFYKKGETVTLSKDKTTFYAVFATVDGGGATDNTNVYTSNVSINAGTAITNTSVVIDQEEYNATKAGTGSANGSVLVTIPAGTTYLSFYMAGWRGEGDKTITLTGAEAEPSSFKTIADNGVTGNGNYELEGNVAQYAYSTTLNNVTQETQITFSNGGADQRFVIWGVNASAGATYSNYSTTCVPAPKLVSITQTAGQTEFTEGDEFVKATITATYDDESTKDVTSKATFSTPDMTQVGEKTISVSYKEGEVTAETSYKINIKEKTKYTINWWANGEKYHTQTAVEGTAIDVPASSDVATYACDDKVFVGWVDAEIIGSTNTEPTFITEFGEIEGDKAFFAVFATEQSSSTTTSVYKLVTNISGGKEYIFATGNSAGSVNGLTCDANSNLTATSLAVKVSSGITYIETPASNNVVWNITSSNSSYNAQNKGQSGKYLRCYGISPNAVIAASAYALYWDGSKGLYGKSNSGNTSYYLYYNTSNSQWGAKSSPSGRVYAFEKSEITFDNTTYSGYVTTCEASTETLSGKFSTGKYEYAEFATGNLQYKPSTDTWRFAKQQYQYVGEANINVGDPNYKGWIDMFGWSADGKFGVNPSCNKELYTGDFVDWGTQIGEGWLTLTETQWNYLLNTRPNHSTLKQIAMVGETRGIMLFPDNWTGTTVEPTYDDELKVYVYKYNLVQWADLEAKGVIFLPAAGRRFGGYGNTYGVDGTTNTGAEYKIQYKTNYFACYWTSTKHNDAGAASYLFNYATSGDSYKYSNLNLGWYEYGHAGHSVRLAKVTSTLVEIGSDDNREVIEANAGQKVNVQVNRTFKANDGYYTICLPFDLDAEKIGKALQISSVTENVAEQGMNVVFTEVTNLVAGQPYLVLPSENLTNPIFEGVKIVDTEGETTETVSGAGINITFTGIINGSGTTNGSTEYYVGDKGWLYNGEVDKLGLRAFFTITDAAGQEVKNIRARVVTREDAATGFENITNGENTTIKLIENGQLIIIRNGEKFNAQGQKL